MQSSDVKKPTHRGLILAVKIVLFTVIALLMIYGLGEWLYPSGSEGSQITRRLNQAKTSEEPLDVMVLGSSTCFHSFVPKYYNELTGTNSVLLSSSMQTMAESLALLEDTVDAGKIPGTVLLYVGPAGRFINLHSNYSAKLFENMSLSAAKVRLFVNLRFDPDEWPDLLLKGYRAREYLEERLDSLIPSAGAEGAYTMPDNYVDYLGNGFSENDEPVYSADSVMLTSKYTFSPDTVNTTVMGYVQSIAELCQSKGIRLILVAPPRLPADILLCNVVNYSSDYSVLHDYIQDLCDSYGVQFWDMNYIRPELLTMTYDMYQDSHHGNARLAFPVTQLLAEMMTKLDAGELNLSDYLYDSFDAYKAAYSTIQGFWVNTSYSKDKARNERYFRVLIAAGDTSGYEIRAWKSSKEDGEYELVQDWDATDRVYIGSNSNKKYYYKIEIRDMETQTVQQWGICAVGSGAGSGTVGDE